MNYQLNQSLIQSTLVSNKLRGSFLPKHLGNNYLRFESMIYQMMDHFCKNYSGGYWEFYELSNNGFYMAPQSGEPYNLFIEGNGYEDIVSNDAAGIIVTSYVLNKLVWMTESELLVDKYYFLLDFAGQHPESGQIFAAID